MVVHTWGFVQSRPDSPWVKVELRAEPGAVFRVSGMPYAAALASLARIRSAMQSIDVRWPGKALTLHVHPALRGEEVNELDVPVALALLAIRKKLGGPSLSKLVSTGMLGLDGEARLPKVPSPIQGLRIPAPPNGILRAMGPPSSFRGQHRFPVQEGQHLSDILGLLNRPPPQHTPLLNATEASHGRNWNHIEGEGTAKSWLCIGAKFRLHAMLVGPPGVGKSSLVRAAHALLPTDGPESKPFLAPHPAGGTGGLLGSWRRGEAVPGAWAMADQGLLFLDEFSEWPRPARESLRHIMDTGTLHLHRAEGSALWTSHPWIVAAMNLCACGQHPERCACDPSERRKHRRKVSAPLLERFPIQLDLGGQDASQCLRSWEDCQSWVQGPGAPPETWSTGARQLANTMEKHAMNSKRVQGHLHSLAAAHAHWAERDHVAEDDVQAAFDVLWMNRSGWWGSP